MSPTLLPIVVQEDGQKAIVELNGLFAMLKTRAIENELTQLTNGDFPSFGEEKKAFLVDLFSKHRKRLEDTEKVTISNDIPILTGFNWRMEVEVASR